MSDFYYDRKVEKPPRVPQHGKLNEYAKYKCRCATCKAAKAESAKAHKDRKERNERILRDSSGSVVAQEFERATMPAMQEVHD